MNTNLSLIVAVSLLAVFGSATADESYWVSLSPNVSMNRASIANAGESDMSVWIQRNYEQQITLGTDPQSGQELYRHRSVQIQYVVNCRQNKLNIVSWKLFSGNDSQGAVVLADQAHAVDAAYRYSPMSAEEKSVAANLCGSAVVSR